MGTGLGSGGGAPGGGGGTETGTRAGTVETWTPIGTGTNVAPGGGLLGLRIGIENDVGT